MKNAVKCLVLISCFAFGASMAHACPTKDSVGIHGHMGGMMPGNMDANGGDNIDSDELGACRKKCSGKPQAL